MKRLETEGRTDEIGGKKEKLQPQPAIKSFVYLFSDLCGAHHSAVRLPLRDLQAAGPEGGSFPAAVLPDQHLQHHGRGVPQREFRAVPAPGQHRLLQRLFPADRGRFRRGGLPKLPAAAGADRKSVV